MITLIVSSDSVDPLDPVATSPDPVTSHAILGNVDTVAVLLTLCPLASVAATIGPPELSKAMLLVHEVVAYVLAAVLPGEGAAAVHFVVQPLAFELAIVAPDVDTPAVYVVFVELTDVVRVVHPQKHALTLLLAS